MSKHPLLQAAIKGAAARLAERGVRLEDLTPHRQERLVELELRHLSALLPEILAPAREVLATMDEVLTRDLDEERPSNADLMDAANRLHPALYPDEHNFMLGSENQPRPKEIR